MFLQEILDTLRINDWTLPKEGSLFCAGFFWISSPHQFWDPSTSPNCWQFRMANHYLIFDVVFAFYAYIDSDDLRCKEDIIKRYMRYMSFLWVTCLPWCFHLQDYEFAQVCSTIDVHAWERSRVISTTDPCRGHVQPFLEAKNKSMAWICLNGSQHEAMLERIGRHQLSWTSDILNRKPFKNPPQCSFPMLNSWWRKKNGGRAEDPGWGSLLSDSEDWT